MPRHSGNYNTNKAAYERLRNLKLAVQTRAEQVKLRRLEWDTQTLALPHITPMPGDGDLQVRKPLTENGKTERPGETGAGPESERGVKPGSIGYVTLTIPLALSGIFRYGADYVPHYRNTRNYV